MPSDKTNMTFSLKNDCGQTHIKSCIYLRIFNFKDLEFKVPGKDTQVPGIIRNVRQIFKQGTPNQDYDSSEDKTDFIDKYFQVQECSGRQ